MSDQHDILREPASLGWESRRSVKPRTKTLVDGLQTPQSLLDAGLLEVLFNQMPDVAFFVKDDHGCYVAVNDSLIERHGIRKRSDVIGKRPIDICPGDLGRIPSEQDDTVLRSGKPILDQLELHWYAPHQPGWCLTTKLPIRDSAGRVIGLVGISRDVRIPESADEIPLEFAKALTSFVENLSEPITPALLARRAKLSPQRFARLMKRVHGLTPSQFIAKTRIATASRLLRETDQSVADIATACGFYDHSAFTRTFRSATGVTPSEFRGR
jgi:AraC-like DNA-binding protein